MAAMSDNTAANKKHWDVKAATYETDPKWEKSMAQLIAAVEERRDFIGVSWARKGESDRTVRMIDYACGPGTISRALHPYVTQCRGVDLSTNMVAQYKARAKVEPADEYQNLSGTTQGLTPEQMDAFEGNILDDDGAALSDPTLRDADLACVSMAMHHMDDPARVALKLVERLRPGGVLFVIDFVRHEVPGGGSGAEHGAGMGEVFDATPTIAHNGFSPEQVRDMFEQAGAGDDFAFELVDSVEMPASSTVKPVIFFARGTKKAAASL
uniref:Methyltransferase n=1 Tax=Pyricularia oryzae (strain 70-15 / ATCC MYA-4617 / FGSC 8958) TaxID=242507 RepID=Q2KFE1_PYRO7|nr:hypothetical protein MGCH7_ch7g745 [Pyricularia oryzae 70-15]